MWSQELLITGVTQTKQTKAKQKKNSHKNSSSRNLWKFVELNVMLFGETLNKKKKDYIGLNFCQKGG